MQHVFGPPPVEGLGVTDVLCTEPKVKNRRFPVERTFHVTFKMLRGGKLRCSHCGERFP